MRRQFLSSRRAQVLNSIITGILFLTVCCNTVAAQSPKDTNSASVTVSTDSINESISSQIDSDADTDTEDAPSEKGTTVPSANGDNDSPSDTKSHETVIKASKTLGKQQRVRKTALNFVTFAGSVIRNKLKDPLGKISWISVHFRKIIVLAISLLLILFTVSYYRGKREQGRFLTTTRLSIMDKEVQRACRYIEEHYEDPECNLTSVCMELVTGEAFLDALFVKELGLTISDFIDQVRINRAKIAMRKEPHVAIESLAESVGYLNTDRFLSSFKKITGSDYPEYKDALTPETTVADA